MAEKAYVTLDAIKSLEMKCKNKSCDATISYPLSQLRAQPLHYLCPVCHEPWMKPDGDADQFIRNLAKWKLVLENEGSDLGVELRLEIAAGN